MKKTEVKKYLNQSAQLFSIRVFAQITQFGIFSYWTYVNGFSDAGRFSLSLSVALVIAAVGGAGFPILFARITGPRINDLEYRRTLIILLLAFSTLSIAVILILGYLLFGNVPFDLYKGFILYAFISIWRDLLLEYLNIEKKFFSALGIERLITLPSLILIFAVLCMTGYASIAYPSAFFGANFLGMLFLFAKSHIYDHFSLKYLQQILHRLQKEFLQSLRLGLNNLINVYSFNIFIIIGGLIASTETIGGITLAHMVSAVVLYAQPVLVNRLTPFLYEYADDNASRKVWRGFIDKSVYIGYPVTFLVILFAGLSIAPLFIYHNLMGFAAMAAAFLFGYVARLIGSVNQLWLIHLQRLTNLWKWNLAVLLMSLIILFMFGEEDTTTIFVIVYALNEWVRGAGFSILAQVYERAY